MICTIEMEEGQVVVGTVKDGKFYAKRCVVNDKFPELFYILCGTLMRHLGIDYKIDVTSWGEDSKKCGFRIVENESVAH